MAFITPPVPKSHRMVVGILDLFYLFPFVPTLLDSSSLLPSRFFPSVLYLISRIFFLPGQSVSEPVIRPGAKSIMTTYGTIPTAPPSTNLEFISHAKDRARSALATRRPWKEMVHLHAFGIPSSVGEAFSRVRTNLAYFRTNYAMFVLLVVFLSLLWHPISLIVFVIMMAAWVFLYFLRDEPLVIMSRTISDRVVLVVLAIVTFVALLLTHATTEILVSLLVAVVIVLAHAAVRKTDDLFMDQQGRPGGMYPVVVDPSKRPLTQPSAPSSSSS
ncbi:PRA1 family protein F3-like [Aristolochia californica]|uniref:PRA1 family protein F3-like n=1 Tax=Aristolochia californica TaxID=171875 RepID=UPI0035DEEBB2